MQRSGLFSLVLFSQVSPQRVFKAQICTEGDGTPGLGAVEWPGVEGALCLATLPESPQAAPVAGHSSSWGEGEDLEPEELSSHTCALGSGTSASSH